MVEQLCGDDDGDDDIANDDVDDLKDAIGVLGGGWLSLPLLTGQRRSANISPSSHYSHILFYATISSHYSSFRSSGSFTSTFCRQLVIYSILF